MSGEVFGALRRRLRGSILLVVASVGLLAACHADVSVDVTVEEDGSGAVAVTVDLDREAASLLVDLGGDGFRVDDLTEAGWVLTPPSASSDGAVRTTATKPFGTPEQFADIMNELSGPEGLFQDFALVRDRSFAQVQYEVEGRIVPGSLEVLGDDELVAVLGRDLEALAADAGGSASDVDVTVTVTLPGAVNADGSTGAVVTTAPDGTAARSWRTGLDSSASTDVAMQSSTQKVAALVWRGVAVLAGVLAALVLFGHILRLVRPERRRSASRRGSRPPSGTAAGGAARAAGAESQPGAGEAAAGADPGQAAAAGRSVAHLEGNDIAPRLVALDGMGVLYREGDDIHQLLVPFVRERGSGATIDEIVSRARNLSLGRITTAEFWAAVGVEGEPNEIDDDYLALFQLNPGVVRFLRSLRAEGVRVACVTNDCTTWANKLRARHSLDALIDPWVVSGAVGVRKPDPPIFEVLRRVTREAPAAILVVDDDLTNLDAARELGFATAWFAPDAQAEDAREHPILRSFTVVDPASRDGAVTSPQ